MRPIPRIDIAELRRIGETHWDAITSRQGNSAQNGQYDSFLATGAAMLWNGESDARVCDYFVGVELECLGIDTGPGIRERAQLFTTAIREYLESLSDGAPLVEPD